MSADALSPGPSFASCPRPALRYHGGKWILARWILQFFPVHRIYAEPYSGAASLLLQKPPCYSEVYNDLDGEIVNVFRVLRNATQARELERLLRLTPFAREEFEEAYLESGDPIEAARRTMIKSFMGFGSDGICATWRTGFRANSSRSGTTPAKDWVNFAEAVPAFTQRLRNVIIESRPALEILRGHDTAATLFYCDPPYLHSTRTQGGGSVRHRYRHEMTEEDHRELARSLHKVKGMVVLSGYPCDLYDVELYSAWRRVQKAALADGAAKRTECLWLNPAAAERVQHTLDFEERTASK